jgi:uroporphyrinogen decarboxylase
MEFKAQTKKNFLDILNSPADVAEVTMQPLRRYSVDAAILFSDILVVPEALGIRVEMPGGKGIQIPEPLVAPEDLARLPKLEEAATPAFIEAKLGHVIEAVQSILAQMKKEGFGARPLIGFSAAPWTLMFYMVGSSSKTQNGLGEQWCRERPEASRELMTLLTRVVIEYMSAQVRAGCHALQVFEAMGEFMSPDTFREFALPAMAEIARELRKRHPGMPLMVFPRGACYGLADLQTAGYDVITVDTDTDLAEAAQALREEAAKTGGPVATLQGNFDPKWLRPAEGGTPEAVRREVKVMLEKSGALGEGSPRLIANLGEGLGGKESPELVAEFVNTIHELSSGPAPSSESQSN